MKGNKANKTKKVSVCVVTFNQEKYIHQCLESLVNQETDFDFEIIVADDCSTDRTSAIVQDFFERYPEKIRFIRHKNNIGPYMNFLLVHQQAVGDYVAHVDGDDYALPGKLSAQAAILDSQPNCTAVWHRVDYFNDLGEFCPGGTSDLSIFDNGRVYFEDAIRLGSVGIHSSLMYRRSARDPVQGNQKLLDLYFTWDLLSKGSGYILSDVLGGYRVASSGSLSSNSSQLICRLTIKHAEDFLQKFPKQRRNFFIWGVTNAFIQAKRLRWAALDYVLFSLKNLSPVPPKEIYKNLVNIQKIQVRWNTKGSRTVVLK